MEIRLIVSVILFFSFSSRSFSKVGYLSNYWFTESVEKNIQEYKVIQQEEKRRKKLEEIEIKEKERLDNG